MGAMQDANTWTQARGAWQERDVSIGEPRVLWSARGTADQVPLLQQARDDRKEAVMLTCLQCMDGFLQLLKEEVSNNPPQHASKSKGSKTAATKKGGVAHQLPTINEE